jgi:hypothetical protein
LDCGKGGLTKVKKREVTNETQINKKVFFDQQNTKVNKKTTEPMSQPADLSTPPAALDLPPLTRTTDPTRFKNTSPSPCAKTWPMT